MSSPAALSLSALVLALLLSCAAAPALAFKTPGDGVIRNGALKRDVNGKEMDTHDGKIVQWAPGGPYYMYSMEYGRDVQSAYSDLNPDPAIAGLISQNPGGPANASICDLIIIPPGQAGARYDHNITIYTSPDLTDKSWTLVRREGLPMSARPLGLYYRPKVVYNMLTSLYVMW
jgi:hypothetical protein